WEVEPLNRCIFGILACVIMMLLCVWTAVHLNISEYGKWKEQMARKFGWLVAALLAPEIVHSFALLEFDLSCSCASHKTRPMSRTHTYSSYTAMGGFFVDTRDLDTTYLPGDRQKMALTVARVKFVAKHDSSLLPDLSETKIQDKSKANTFTNMLTCGQAVWLVIQCVTRWSQGFSISLLEINTAVHSLCTLIIYFLFWWKKPLDADEATTCQGQEIHTLGPLKAARYLFCLRTPLR
ncbi:hypothetical protein BU25DRAFT_354884, partial [Macroventuria anomochaeta]